MLDVLQHDEKEWENEFAVLPPIQMEKTSMPYAAKQSMLGKVPGKLVNLTEFSGYLADSNASIGNSNLSMGKYFSKRCEGLREMLPNKSPTKNRPIALLADLPHSGKNIF